MKVDFSSMTLREKVLQTFVTNLHMIKRVGSLEKFFRQYPVGGIYFSKGSVADLAGLMESGTITSADFIKECRCFSKYPLLVCADGANIENGLHVDFRALSACFDEGLAYEAGKVLGIQMRYHDIDWILGPCIDLSLDRNADMFSGAVTDDAEYNARLYAQVTKGIQDQGIAATAKHFPGQGTYHVNFHYSMGQNIMDMKTWMDTVGMCYRRQFQQDCMSVMTSHMMLRAWAEEGDNGYPPIATYSTKITMDLLKKELGFKGAVVTDALIMGGMGCGDQVKEAVQAFKSGADLLLWPPMESLDIIVEQLESGEIPMERLEDALERIQRMRGFIEEGKKNAVIPDAEYVDTTCRRMIGGGIELRRNHTDVIPLKAGETGKLLVIGNAPDERRMEPIRIFSKRLEKRGFDVSFQEYLLTCWQEEINEIIAPYEYVIIVLNHPFAVGCFERCASTTWAANLVAPEKKIIINFSSSYLSDDYYLNDSVVINANQSINEESIDEVLDRLTGEKAFTGRTPLKLNDEAWNKRQP